MKKLNAAVGILPPSNKLKTSDRILTANSADPCNTSISACGSVPVFMTYRLAVITKSGTEEQQQYFCLKKKKKKKDF